MHDGHETGLHVGRYPDDVTCGACIHDADTPARPTMTRAEYLNRKVEHMAAEMRMHADLAMFERQAVLEL